MSTPNGTIKVKRQSSASPDSTTVGPLQDSDLNVGDQVLSHGKDGKFYLGTISEIEDGRDRCLVLFGDGSRVWSSRRNVRRVPVRSRLSCSRCQLPSEEPLVRCLLCRLAFHLSCVYPQSTPVALGWRCCRCSELKREPSPCALQSTGHKQLPYSLSSLNWSSDHKVNREQAYCYCGGPGDWFCRMLQCLRCRQWFHEVCVDCLLQPMLLGDRYYAFCCSVCTNDGELLQRLQLRWQEVVHLALFSLTVTRRRRYHDLDADLLPWIDEHWTLLQAPIYLQTVPRQLRRGQVLRVLRDSSNKSCFLSGRENKKRPGLWCLRVKAPPPAPVVQLPPGGPLHLPGISVRYPGAGKARLSPVKLGVKHGRGGVSAYGAVKKRACTLPAAGTPRRHVPGRRLRARLPPTGPSTPASSSCSGVDSESATARPSSDETAAGTLDALIPPAAHNPFRSAGRAVVTRQLQAKDICIGKNGEVRRRRRRQGGSGRWRVGAEDGATGSSAAADALFRPAARLLARRVTADGALQYLVQWET